MIHAAQILIGIQLLIIGADVVQRGARRTCLLIEVGKRYESSFREWRPFRGRENVQRDGIQERTGDDIVRKWCGRPGRSNRASDRRIRIARVPSVARLQDLGKISASHRKRGHRRPCRCTAALAAALIIDEEERRVAPNRPGKYSPKLIPPQLVLLLI